MPSNKKRYTFTYQGKRYSVFASSAKEAGLRIAERQKELETESKSRSGSQLVKDWALECIDTYKTNLRPKVRRDYVDLVRHCILEAIGDLQLKAVQPIDCQQCLNRLSGMSNSYINAVFQALHFIFKYAVINGRISTDPTEGLIKPTGTRKKRRALTPEEREKVLATAPQQRTWWVYLLMMLCGCRPGEAAECKGSDLETVMSMSGDPVHILHIRGTKTKAADRRVPVPDELYNLIKDVPNDEYISVTRGNGKHGQNWSRHFRTFCRHAGITADDLSAYNLRHEYGTECARRGLDVRVTMRLMGHSSIKMTAEVYTNLEDSDVLSSVSTLRHVRSGVHPDDSASQDVHPTVHPTAESVGNA